MSIESARPSYLATLGFHSTCRSAVLRFSQIASLKQQHTYDFKHMLWLLHTLECDVHSGQATMSLSLNLPHNNKFMFTYQTNSECSLIPGPLYIKSCDDLITRPYNKVINEPIDSYYIIMRLGDMDDIELHNLARRDYQSAIDDLAALTLHDPTDYNFHTASSWGLALASESQHPDSLKFARQHINVFNEYLTGEHDCCIGRIPPHLGFDPPKGAIESLDKGVSIVGSLSIED